MTRSMRGRLPRIGLGSRNEKALRIKSKAEVQELTG